VVARGAFLTGSSPSDSPEQHYERGWDNRFMLDNCPGGVDVWAWCKRIPHPEHRGCGHSSLARSWAAALGLTCGSEAGEDEISCFSSPTDFRDPGFLPTFRPTSIRHEGH
jgi:hypothetical protein